MDKYKEFNIDNPLPPLWLMYPHISRYSIGWRMGYGEYYSYEFHDWFKTLSTDEKKYYKKLFPLPITWYDYYNNDDNSSELAFKCNNYTIDFWRKGGLPLYTLNSLQDLYKDNPNLEFLFFWGHTPSKDGNLTNSCLSQWWQSDFWESIDKYFCMEQYMMAEKARVFNDEEILIQILNSNSPAEIKKLGRKASNFSKETWDKVKHSIVLTGSYYKFSQNDLLRNYLISTNKSILVEASPYDDIWGIKMDTRNKDVSNPTKWRGQNMLGFALMEVRDEICRVYQNYNIVGWEKVKKIFE